MFLTIFCATLWPCFIRQSLICYTWDLVKCAYEGGDILGSSEYLKSDFTLRQLWWDLAFVQWHNLFYTFVLSAPLGHCSIESQTGAAFFDRKTSFLDLTRFIRINSNIRYSAPKSHSSSRLFVSLLKSSIDFNSLITWSRFVRLTKKNLATFRPAILKLMRCLEFICFW